MLERDAKLCHFINNFKPNIARLIKANIREVDFELPQDVLVASIS
jgi:hypothetical protein